MQTDRTLTFTTLSAGTEYFLYAQVNSVDYVVAVDTGGDSGPQPAFQSGFTNGQVPIWNAAHNQFEGGSAGSATTVATDTIWDAKGDLAVGSGADTAVKKSVGPDGSVLMADSASAGGVKWTDSIANAKRKLWVPSTSVTGLSGMVVVDESGTRASFGGTAAAPPSGQLKLNGNLVVPAGATVTKISFYAVGASTSPTHQWFCLTDLAGNILGITADDTNTAWGATSFKTLALTSAYTNSTGADLPVYAGVLITAGAVNTLPIWTAGNVGGEVPKMSLLSTSSLTTPASAGSSVLTGAAQSNAGLGYCILRSD